MELKIATSFPWLILLVFLARPVCMQVNWDADSVCGDDVRDPICYASDPIHQWDIDLPDCSADSVRVVYSNYQGADGTVLGSIDFREIRLHCTAPGGTLQAELMPTSVNCSGTSTDGNWREDGFVFRNLNASGIQLQSGWTCTVSGCFLLDHAANGVPNEYINAPSKEFVLRSGDCVGAGPSPTVEPVMALSTTVETVTLHATVEPTALPTTVNTVTTGNGMNVGTGTAVTATSIQPVTTVANVVHNITGTNLLIIGFSTVVLALMMLTTITLLMLAVCWKVWTNITKVPAASIHVVGKNNTWSNEVCRVELGSESFNKVSGISMDKKY